MYVFFSFVQRISGRSKQKYRILNSKEKLTRSPPHYFSVSKSTQEYKYTLAALFIATGFLSPNAIVQLVVCLKFGYPSAQIKASNHSAFREVHIFEENFLRPLSLHYIANDFRLFNLQPHHLLQQRLNIECDDKKHSRKKVSGSRPTNLLYYYI